MLVEGFSAPVVFVHPDTVAELRQLFNSGSTSSTPVLFPLIKFVVTEHVPPWDLDEFTVARLRKLIQGRRSS